MVTMIFNTLYPLAKDKILTINSLNTKEIHAVEYAPWSQEEISDYKQTDYKHLLDLYGQKNLSNPESRAKFIAEELIPDFTMSDHEVLMRIGKTDGRGVALSCLEQWAEKFLRECFP